jgi:putative PIN family toxin of toxin-antitoxin system
VRAVLDTNILISAFVFPGGAPEAAYRAALEGRFELVTSPPLLAELGRVLEDKFGWEGPMAEAAVAQVARIGTVVRPRQAVSAIEQDPADDRVLEAAAEGEADAIVSGDRHLLQLRQWQGVRILRAVAWLDEIGRTEG